jgi:glucose-1-phosphate thymidylyltransferase
MQGIITAAGKGTRSGLDGKLRKEMLPIYYREGDRIVLRPMIEVIASMMKLQGVDRISIVLDPADRRTAEYVSANIPYSRIVYQEPRNGYGGAVLSAAYTIMGDYFLLNAGDGILLKENIFSRMIRMRESGLCSNVLVVMEVDNPQNYGTADLRMEHGRIYVTGVTEKDPSSRSNFALCALYLLDRTVLDHLSKDRSNVIELTPAIQKSIEGGTKTCAIRVRRSEWASLGQVTDYANVVNQSMKFF